MSENRKVGKLKLKGKPLDVMAGGLKKKKKPKKVQYERIAEIAAGDGNAEQPADAVQEDTNETDDLGQEERRADIDDHLTPAERRYIEQRERIDVRRLAKTANKSHRDRIQDFNQYLANMSEHYDIPKVGPG